MTTRSGHQRALQLVAFAVASFLGFTTALQSPALYSVHIATIQAALSPTKCSVFTPNYSAPKIMPIVGAKKREIAREFSLAAASKGCSAACRY